MTIFEGSLSLDGFPNIFRPTQEPIYAVKTHPVTPFKTHCSWLITQGCCSLLKVNARHFCAKKMPSYFDIYHVYHVPPNVSGVLGATLLELPFLYQRMVTWWLWHPRFPSGFLTGWSGMIIEESPNHQAILSKTKYLTNQSTRNHKFG